MPLPDARAVLGDSARGDAMKLDYQPGDFDFIFSNSVIEHMGSREGQLRHCPRRH